MANAEVDYIDEQGKVLVTLKFYDPGLDPSSEYARQQMATGRWRGLHMAYRCGRPIDRNIRIVP